MKRRGLLARLLWSHLALALVASLFSAGAIYAIAFVVEDQTYRALLENSLVEVRQGASLGTSAPLRAWPLDQAPPPWKMIAQDLPDGVTERGYEGKEAHLGLATDPQGQRWLVVLQSGEVDGGRTAVVVLGGAVLAFSLAALAMGYAVARRTLAPLDALALLLDQGDPSPGELLHAAGGDEVGRVARRLAEVMQSREATLRHQEQFLSDASHELRNPISILQGALQLMREPGQADGQAVQQRLDRMDRSVSRMRSTVEGLLRIARQEQALDHKVGQSLLESLPDLIEEVRDQSSPQVELELNARAAPSGAPDLWLIILRNLLDNAVQATTAGTIRVELDMHKVTVSDTGLAFRKNWEPYSRTRPLCTPLLQGAPEGWAYPSFDALPTGWTGTSPLLPVRTAHASPSHRAVTPISRPRGRQRAYPGIGPGCLLSPLAIRSPLADRHKPSPNVSQILTGRFCSIRASFPRVLRLWFCTTKPHAHRCHP